MGKFSEEIIKQVWMKAFAQSNNNPEDFRKDYAGAWIKYSEYQQKTDYGWCIGYIVPPSKSGDKRIENLIPLHWKIKNRRVKTILSGKVLVPQRIHKISHKQKNGMSNI
jgi:hypothetical protein